MLDIFAFNIVFYIFIVFNYTTKITGTRNLN